MITVWPSIGVPSSIRFMEAGSDWTEPWLATVVFVCAAIIPLVTLADPAGDVGETPRG